MFKQNYIRMEKLEDKFLDRLSWIIIVSLSKGGIIDSFVDATRSTFKMNGFDLYRKLKNIDDNVQYCFMTAYEVYYETLKKDYPGLNIGWFIKKPISNERLVKEIKSKLRSWVCIGNYSSIVMILISLNSIDDIYS